MTTGDYIAAIAVTVALGGLLLQWYAYRRQRTLEAKQARFGDRQQTAEEQQRDLQQKVAQIEEARYQDEQRRKRRAYVTVELPIGSVRGEDLRELWLLLCNSGEAGAREVDLKFDVVKHVSQTIPKIYSSDDLPIVNLGPGQRYPIRLGATGFFVAIATVTWKDDDGEHAERFQISPIQRFSRFE